MKVEVYRNLHQKCWSVRDCKTGKVVDHVQSVHLNNANLVVQPAGHAKVLREQRKNVHAFVRGWVSPPIVIMDYIMEALNKGNELRPTKQVTYNPYKYDSFVYAETETPIYKADHIFLDDNGQGWIYD